MKIKTEVHLEKRLISEISNCNECKCSENWLGRYSKKEKIRESGLWQVNELYKKGLSEVDFIEIRDKLISDINNLVQLIYNGGIK